MVPEPYLLNADRLIVATVLSSELHVEFRRLPVCGQTAAAASTNLRFFLTYYLCSIGRIGTSADFRRFPQIIADFCLAFTVFFAPSVRGNVRFCPQISADRNRQGFSRSLFHGLDGSDNYLGRNTIGEHLLNEGGDGGHGRLKAEIAIAAQS